MAYMTDIQQNAQAALPVIPNNGNPSGAYNMANADPAGVTGAGAMPTQSGYKSNDPLSWVQPSEYMSNIKEILKQQLYRLQMQQNEQQQLYNYVPRGQNLNFQEVDDNGLPVDRYHTPLGNESPVLPMKDDLDSMGMPKEPPSGIVIPEEYKQELLSGQIY